MHSDIGPSVSNACSRLSCEPESIEDSDLAIAEAEVRVLKAKRRKAEQDAIDAKERNGANCVTEELAWAFTEKTYQGLWHSEEPHRPALCLPLGTSFVLPHPKRN